MTDRDNEIISMIEWHVGHDILMSNKNLKEVFDLIERQQAEIDGINLEFNLWKVSATDTIDYQKEVIEMLQKQVEKDDKCVKSIVKIVEESVNKLLNEEMPYMDMSVEVDTEILAAMHNLVEKVKGEINGNL